MTDFLVLAPHIDDEALGCGGILDERFHVHYCGVETFRIIDRESRLAEAKACSELLGFSFSVELENQVNQYQVPDLIGQIEAVITEHHPHTIFLPYPSYNQDHRATVDAALVALRPHDLNHQVANILFYEQVHVALWPWRDQLLRGESFQPQVFAPIDLDHKIAAYQCHGSQVRGMRSKEHVRILARWRGLQSGFEHAEGFQAIRMTRPCALVLGLLRQEQLPPTPRR